MNLKTKMKNFFTLTRKANGGFTLVELIVVIAILAILGGVAVPAYNGYVKKANMQADISLASDVADALTLYYYSNPNEAASGYVVLKPNGEAATGDGVVSGAAMQAVFGDNWEEIATLKHDGWPSASALLSSALDAGSLNSSSYVTNSTVTELLGNVQTVTSAAAELLGSLANRSEDQYLFALENAMGTAYMESAVAAGVLGKDEDGNYIMLDDTYDEMSGGKIKVHVDLQNQLSNLMVFGVANQMGSNTSTDEMVKLMLSGLTDESVDKEKYRPGTIMAAQYALYKAYAVDCGKQDEFEELNTAMSNATSLAAAKEALENFKVDNGTELMSYISDDEARLVKNAEAIIEAMNGVTAVSPDYATKETLAGSNLFTSDDVTNDFDVFVGMARIGESLTEPQKAELKALLANNPNAIVVILANGMAVSTIG